MDSVKTESIFYFANISKKMLFSVLPMKFRRENTLLTEIESFTTSPFVSISYFVASTVRITSRMGVIEPSRSTAKSAARQACFFSETYFPMDCIAKRQRMKRSGIDARIQKSMEVPMMKNGIMRRHETVMKYNEECLYATNTVAARMSTSKMMKRR